MSKKIILSFDGTWNTPDNDADILGGVDTNVCRLHQRILSRDQNGITQLKWYDEGVGCKWYDRFKGGIFGVGLSQNIQEGYAKLVDVYEPGDQVYLFGFSRGAYTARSLVGLIRNAGLLRKDQSALPELIQQAYSLYRTRDRSADEESAKRFRAEYSREIEIHFIGVWDTVGALGIPLSSFEWFNRSYYQFHDTRLSGIVKNAFQALAIDEHRKAYQATLWQSEHKPGQVIEQVWFLGAHANVGGGYADNPLSDISLVWMMEKAGQCGLAIGQEHRPDIAQSHMAPIVDSYKEFLNGAYSLFSDRHYRPIGTTAYGTEKIDPSVQARYKEDSRYRPRNKVGGNLSGACQLPW